MCESTPSRLEVLLAAPLPPFPPPTPPPPPVTAPFVPTLAVIVGRCDAVVAGVVVFVVVKFVEAAGARLKLPLPLVCVRADVTVGN